jgi:hypothetical protein
MQKDVRNRHLVWMVKMMMRDKNYLYHHLAAEMEMKVIQQAEMKYSNVIIDIDNFLRETGDKSFRLVH